MNILQVNSSARAYANGAGSISTRLGDELVHALLAAHAGATHTLRDLTRQPHPVLDARRCTTSVSACS
jgi:FMN-dependent NADH-azoreductase